MVLSNWTGNLQQAPNRPAIVFIEVKMSMRNSRHWLKRAANAPLTSTVPGIELGTRYDYYITTLDDDRAESLPSDSLCYLLIEKVSLLSNTNEPRPTFSWHIGAISAERYVLKLIEADTDRRIWVTRVKSFYSQSKHVKLNQDGTAVVDSLLLGDSTNGEWIASVRYPIRVANHYGNPLFWSKV